MAAAGPAMEVVGRYSEVLDAQGEPVDIYTFLPLARAAVQEAMAVEIDHQPLDTFDARTRFALWWVRLYGRQAQAKVRTALADPGLRHWTSTHVRDLDPRRRQGRPVRHRREHSAAGSTPSPPRSTSRWRWRTPPRTASTRWARCWRTPAATPDDAYLWAAVQFLADRLPDTDPDAIAFTPRPAHPSRASGTAATAAAAAHGAETVARRSSHDDAAQADVMTTRTADDREPEHQEDSHDHAR